MANTITIGISFSETKYPNYPAWILGKKEGIEIVVLSWETQNSEDLKKCQGLLLTGGVDIDPFFYQPTKTDYPNKPNSWNRRRDKFEMELFTEAQSLAMPVLGICRGLQLVNVALGGTLLTDIEEAGKQNHRIQAGIDHVHTIQIRHDTLLAGIAGIRGGAVNSAHHQAISRVAESLLVNCFSQDDIVEGIEWKDKQNCAPLLCVQWHPERIENKETNPLSKNIRDWLLSEAVKYTL